MDFEPELDFIEDTSRSTVGIITNLIDSPNTSKAIKGMKLLIAEKEQSINTDYIDVLARRMARCTDSEVDLLQEILITLKKMFTEQTRDPFWTKEQYEKLVSAFFQSLSKTGQRSQESLNKLVQDVFMKLLDTGSRRFLFSILISRLSKEASKLMTMDSEPSEDYMNYVHRIIKGIWRLQGKQMISDDEDVSMLLLDLHRFFLMVSSNPKKESQIHSINAILEKIFKTIVGLINDAVVLLGPRIESIGINILGIEWKLSILYKYVEQELKSHI